MAEAEIIDILFGIVLLGLGWWMRSLNESIRRLHQSDKDIMDRIQHVEVLVAGKYVTREEVNSQYLNLITKLESIDAKLTAKIDQKVDK